MLSKSGCEFTAHWLLPAYSPGECRGPYLVNLNSSCNLMDNISYVKMPLGTRRQPAGNTRHKDKSEFRLAATSNVFIPEFTKKSLWFLCPIAYFRGRRHGAARHLQSLSSAMQSWKGYSPVLLLLFSWQILQLRLCIIPAACRAI